MRDTPAIQFWQPLGGFGGVKGNSCHVRGVAVPREILTDWKTAAGTGFLTVMYFDTQHTVGQQRTALNTLWANFTTNLLTTATTWTVRTAGRELSDSTGQLTGLWSEAVVHTATGVATGQIAADATQILIQWNTTTIVDGRMIHGRTFVPGLPASSMTGGNLTASVQAAVAGWSTTFVNAGVGFGVWHRPKSFSGGVFAPAQTATCWSELAVQRGRRR